MQSDEIRAIHRRVNDTRYSPDMASRDQTVDNVRLVRRGRIEELFPDGFADALPHSTVANMVDTAARDSAEMMSALPSLACASGNMATQSDETRAAKKNKIGSYYWTKSELDRQMPEFADSYLSYAFGVFISEPDFDHGCPKIRVESPFGCYYELDRWGETVWYAKVTYARAGVLAARYPELYAQIMKPNEHGPERGVNDLIEMVNYIDKRRNMIYLPECQYSVLADTPHGLTRCPVTIGKRFNLEQVPRGQYDDVIWVQLARAQMAIYMMSAAEQSVNAPIAIPDDVQRVAMGPQAVMRSQTPEKVRRVNLDIPRDVFMVQQTLDAELKTGARYPDSRTGGVQGNIITGRGVEALQGTIETQIVTAQRVFAKALERATSLCFEIDVRFWPNKQKRIQGHVTGKPFEITYVPAKDIGDSWGCKTTYGFAAGMTPAQALVGMLQLRGDRVISRDTFRRQLPFEVDALAEQQAVEVEEMEAALIEGFKTTLQGLGAMAMQGQDPLPIVVAAAKAIELRRKGKGLAEAIEKALTPPEKPETEAQLPPEAGPPGMEQELPPGVQDSGRLQGVAPGQAGMPPGGMPAIQGLMAELRGQGDPRMSAATMRKRPIGQG
jgi:tetrahydromethanopterin S-methyltransferase subunit F